VPHVRLSTVKVVSARLCVGSSLAIRTRQWQLRTTAVSWYVHEIACSERAEFFKHDGGRTVEQSRDGGRRRDEWCSDCAESTLNAASACERVSTDGA
jgi:hypothetical protein